jgi:hypothetical protein
MLQTSGIDNLFVSALLPSLLLRKAVRQRTSTHAPLIPSLTWVQVERGASRLQAKFSALSLILVSTSTTFYGVFRVLR